MPRAPHRTKPAQIGGLDGPPNAVMQAYEQLQQAEKLRTSGELAQARAICEKLTAKHPDYMMALHTLGLICADMRDYPQALGCLIRAIMLNPRHWQAYTALSGVYLAMGALEIAAQTLEQAVKINPEDAGIFTTLGEIYRNQREYELAAEAFRKALLLDRAQWAAEIGLADCCVQLGEFAAAAAAARNVVKQRPHSIRPFYLLTSLPAAFVKLDLLPLIGKTVRGKNETELDYESSVHFTRAAALDRAGRHEQAWRHLVAGNQMMFATTREACVSTFQLTDKVLELVCATPAKARDGVAGEGKHAISLFILGPSRSGKTTMERLMGSLSGVKRGYENPIAANALRRAFQEAGALASAYYESLPPTLEPLCRQIYLEDLERRAGSARVFTNTHPTQIIDAVRIAAICPNVRFIFVKRNLDDIALRIFMHRYVKGFAYAYDLGAIRKYVSWYYRMIDMIAEKLPRITLVLQYEDMIADPAAALAAGAALCGLEPPVGPLPEIGDDRGCAEPYRQWMAAALES